MLGKKLDVQIFKKRINTEVSFSGEIRTQKLWFLRKKIQLHEESLFHNNTVKILEKIESQFLKTSFRNKYLPVKKLFYTAYKIVKPINYLFNIFELEIDLEELNGLIGIVYFVQLTRAPTLLMILNKECTRKL